MKSYAKRFWVKYPPELAILLIGSILTRLVGLGSPNATVFDEVYFKQFASGYFTHQYYFDIHPPLGKLILAGWAKLIGVNAATITQPPATGLRLLVALAGISIVLLVYGIVRRLTGSRLAATLAGLAIMLDGVFIVEARFVLVDSLLVAFGMGAIYAAVRWQERHKALWLVLAGLLAGCSVSIKWTGLTALVVVLALLLKGWEEAHRNWKQRLAQFAAVIGLAAIIYLGSFWLHFALLTHSGPGDAFMSPAFQSTLIGNPYYRPYDRLSFWSKFEQLNVEMYHANATLTATHPYGSKWYTWPLELRPVYYWEGAVQANGSQGNIYLFGDPLIWWAATASTLLGLIISSCSRPSFRKRYKAIMAALSLFIFAYLLNWLPFATITRVMFLYHYLFAFIFSVMIMATLVTTLPVNPDWKRSPRHLVAIGLIVVMVGGFLYFAPLTYGWPLSPAAHQARVWLSTWR